MSIRYLQGIQRYESDLGHAYVAVPIISSTVRNQNNTFSSKTDVRLSDADGNTEKPK
ncbi:protein of unknown function [Pararobbsia alpina]